MPEGIYRFSLGSFQCIAIDDERSGGSGSTDDWGDMGFVNATAERVAELVAAHREGPNAWDNGTYCSCLYIDTGRNRVLVDTGSGADAQPGSGALLERLADAGIAPADIDTVILTHGHWDHIGANANAAGQPTFPNARYCMTQAEFRHWTEDPSPFGGDVGDLGRRYAAAHLATLRDRFEFIAPEGEIVPGISAVPAPGHTPGQIALLVQDGDEKLLCLADAFHHPIELVEPGWYFDFDHDPVTTVATRRRLLAWAAQEAMLVHAYHCTFPGLGRVVAVDDHWEWIRP